MLDFVYLTKTAASDDSDEYKQVYEKAKELYVQRLKEQNEVNTYHAAHTAFNGVLGETNTSKPNGSHNLVVENSGKEVVNARLSLLKLENATQTSNDLSVKLNNGKDVDLGTYRYTLLNENNDYRLYNPKAEEQIKEEEAKKAAEEAKRQEEAKKAEEVRKREEAVKAEQARLAALKQAQIVSRYSNTALS